jgi:hypothetical protein
MSSLRTQGPIAPGAGIEGPLHQQFAKIAPFKIVALDQLDLPIALLPLQLFLTGNRLVNSLIGFDINETVNAVGFNKQRTSAIPMLFQPF